MATIVSDTYLEDAARTSGEAWVINNNARLTIRTDTRCHAGAPAGGTGVLGAQTINEGEILIDGRNVRWLPFDSGAGTVPNINFVVTQDSSGAVSGYGLGVWSAPDVLVPPGSPMPETGFIKFREMVSGSFEAGPLNASFTANATGPDVTGWLEVVTQQTRDITVTRLGRYRIYGDRFFLGVTNGNRGQEFQVPSCVLSNSSLAYGMWVETSVGSDEYEYWPALNYNSNGWDIANLGVPRGYTDIRQKFVSVVWPGKMVVGNTFFMSNIAYTEVYSSGTYANYNQTGTYIWENNKVYIMSADHRYDVGEQVGLQFTSGAMFTPINNTGIYTVSEVLSANIFAIDFVGAGTNDSGNVTIRGRLNFTITSTPIRTGYQAYFEFTSGTAASGVYTVHSFYTTNTHSIPYPRTSDVTGGAVNVYYGLDLNIGYTHNYQAGRQLDCQITSGNAVSGIYNVISVPTTATSRIQCPSYGTGTGELTLHFDVGYVPEPGLRVWIPNIILRQCTTGSAAQNAYPHNTIASRPEFVTTASGDIDIDYAYGDWHFNFSQPYRCNLKNLAIADPGAGIYECNQTPVVRNIGVSSVASTPIAANIFSLGSMQQGVDVDTIVGVRGATPGSSQTGLVFSLIYGGTVKNISSAFIQYNRPAASYGIFIDTCYDMVYDEVQLFCGFLRLNAGSNIKITNVDSCNYIAGTSGGYNALNVYSIEGTPDKITIENLTWGLKGTIPNVLPAGLGANTANNFTVRNIGTLEQPLQGRNALLPDNGGVGTLASSGNRTGFKAQNIYVIGAGAPFADVNDSKSQILRNVYTSCYSPNSSQIFTAANAKNSVYQNIGMSYFSVSALSVFGVNFTDAINYYYKHNSSTRCTLGEYCLHMNEPTDDTAQYVTIVSGNPRFNANGGVLMNAVGDEIIFEDPYFRKGYTGFDGRWSYSEPSISGGTYSSYDFYYQIDKGSGFNGEWKPLLVTHRGTSSGTAWTNVISVFGGDFIFYTTFQVGDYVWGTGISPNAVVTSTTQPAFGPIYLSKNHTAAVSGYIRMSRLYTETDIDPSVGFRLKIRIVTMVAGSAALTRVRVYLKHTPESLAQAIYPLDTIPLTLTGLVPNSDIVILKAGTSVELANIDSWSGTNYNFIYEVPENVDICVYKAGYIPFFIRNFMLSSSAASLPIQQVADRNYLP